MGDPIIRPSNVEMLLKIETTEGVDAAPTSADAFPFEEDSYSYNSPFTTEASNEANGTLVAGAPLVIGQPATISLTVRLKGPNATPTAMVKPPHHALLAIAGKRPQFTAGVAAAALVAGGASQATLGAAFSATPQAYRGMPLSITAGPGAGRIAAITDYSAAKVALLADAFSPALTTSSEAALIANWSYAGTSPRGATARATDHPSGTLYLFEDGTLHKFTGCRAVMQNLNAQTARPGMAQFQLTGVYGGKTDADLPSDLPSQGWSAPTLLQGIGNSTPAFLINRKPLPIGSYALADGGAIDNTVDPNTDYGFGPGVIGERVPMITVDPHATLVAVRNTIAEIGALTQYTAVARFGSVLGNRYAITHPLVQPVDSQPGARGQLRSEQMQLRALTPGFDAQTRDSETIICFF